METFNNRSALHSWDHHHNKRTTGYAHDLLKSNYPVKGNVRKYLIICMKKAFSLFLCGRIDLLCLCLALSNKSIPLIHHQPTPDYDTTQQCEDKARTTGRVQMPVNGRANCEKRFNIAHII